MSFGSLSSNAVEALNAGAKIGGFAHNTGEGGISPHHLKYGGDIIWQIGTGYFGCRDEDGIFSKEVFRENVNRPQIKMVELKLSQGAKPGHGGILPAKKNTPEIAPSGTLHHILLFIHHHIIVLLIHPKGLFNLYRNYEHYQEVNPRVLNYA